MDHSGSAREAIRKLLELSTLEMIGDKQHKGCFLVNTAVEIASHDKAINKLVRQTGLEIEQAFYDTIKKGQAKGEITNATDARALARFILNSVKGIRVSVKSEPDKQFFEDIIRLSLSVLD
jgi:TetR/AcrR family transcriptional repressor of nem operon